MTSFFLSSLSQFEHCFNFFLIAYASTKTRTSKACCHLKLFRAIGASTTETTTSKTCHHLMFFLLLGPSIETTRSVVSCCKSLHKYDGKHLFLFVVVACYRAKTTWSFFPSFVVLRVIDILLLVLDLFALLAYLMLMFC